VIGHSVDFALSGPLRQFFQESKDIKLRAWGASESGGVDYITIDGKPQSGGECVFAYGACGVLDRCRSDELGRLSLRGFPSSLLRKIADEDKYIHLHVSVHMVPKESNVLRVGGLDFVILGWNEVEIAISGLGEYRLGRIKVKSPDGLDEWFIDPDGKLSYLGPENRGAERMPAWLRKAWLDCRWIDGCS